MSSEIVVGSVWFFDATAGLAPIRGRQRGCGVWGTTAAEMAAVGCGVGDADHAPKVGGAEPALLIVVGTI